MLTRDQVLDELDDLATVAHALCVEYLFLECALGHDVEVAGSPPAPAQVGDAADSAHSLAVGQMRRLRAIDHLLVLAGRDANLGRATELRQGAEPALPLAPLTAAQLHAGTLDRELAMAIAVDKRYEALALGADPAALDAIEGASSIISFGGGLADAFAQLRDGLAGVAPSAYLRVTRDVASGEVEAGLRDLSDRYYALVVAALRAGFVSPDLESRFVDTEAVGAMFRWDAVHKLLAQAGLLPAFTYPDG